MCQTKLVKMKKFLLILLPLFFVFSAMIAQNKDTNNVYNSMKKSVKDITHGVVADVKDLTGADSAFGKLADSSQVSLGSVYKDIKAGIEGMAAALKVGAVHVYAVLVKQQVAKSIMWLVVLIFSLVFMRIGWNTAKGSKWTKPNNSSEDLPIPTPDNGWAALSGVMWVIGIIGTIVVVFHLQTLITGFVNPEYGAMKDIVNFVQQIKGGNTPAGN
jgi:hypothetical protein